MRLGQCAGLIIIDTFRAATPGADENDSSIRAYVDLLGRVAAETGCTVLILHHAKKRGSNNKTDRRELMRGSSALFDAADAVFFISREAKRECCRVQQIKGREGETAPFEIALHESDEGAELRAYESGGAPTSAEALDQRRREEILELLRNKPKLSQNAICEAVGGKAESTRRLIRDMAKAGDIKNVGRGSKQAWVREENVS
jgi:RecA-family ATPase